MKGIGDHLGDITDTGGGEHKVPVVEDVNAIVLHGLQLRHRGPELPGGGDDLRGGFGEELDDGLGVEAKKLLAINIEIIPGKLAGDIGAAGEGQEVIEIILRADNEGGFFIEGDEGGDARLAGGLGGDLAEMFTQAVGQGAGLSGFLQGSTEALDNREDVFQAIHVNIEQLHVQAGGTLLENFGNILPGTMQCQDGGVDAGEHFPIHDMVIADAGIGGEFRGAGFVVGDADEVVLGLHLEDHVGDGGHDAGDGGGCRAGGGQGGGLFFAATKEQCSSK